MDMQKILEYRNARNRFCQRVGITVTELSPAKAGDVLTAEAREAKHGGTVCVFDIRITDQDGNLDGTGTFTFYNLKKPLKID